MEGGVISATGTGRTRKKKRQSKEGDVKNKMMKMDWPHIE